jgi:hypothetical protein
MEKAFGTFAPDAFLSFEFPPAKAEKSISKPLKA